MGASPTPMAFGEIYTSLQTNVIDGYEHDANTTLMQKFFEVTKYFALTQHIERRSSGIVASAKNLDALPPDMKKAVLDAAKEAAVFQRKRAPEEDEKSMAELKKKGMVINVVDRKPLRGQGAAILDVLQQGSAGGRSRHDDSERKVGPSGMHGACGAGVGSSSPPRLASYRAPSGGNSMGESDLRD